jgi:hypothetical protein
MFHGICFNISFFYCNFMRWGGMPHASVVRDLTCASLQLVGSLNCFSFTSLITLILDMLDFVTTLLRFLTESVPNTPREHMREERYSSTHSFPLNQTAVKWSVSRPSRFTPVARGSRDPQNTRRRSFIGACYRENPIVTMLKGGMRWRSWLGHWATSRKGRGFDSRCCHWSFLLT